MAILVIGGTGQIGSLVVSELAKRGAQVLALGTKAPKGTEPKGVESITGDVLDVDFMRDLLRTVSTVFVLNPAVPDELARVLLTLSLIEEAGIKRVVYLSMMGADVFTESSRAGAKFAAEQTILSRGLPTTILRPNAVFQNDAAQKPALTGQHVYASPVGDVGITMVDIRDVAELAAIELLRREEANDPLPTEIIEVVGPELLTSESVARLWTDVLGASVSCQGDDLDAVESGLRKTMPAASAYDLKLVFKHILQEGVHGAPGAADKVAQMLGRPLRGYRAFAEELVAPDSK